MEHDKAAHRAASERAKDAQGRSPLALARFLTSRGGDDACPDIVTYLETSPGERPDEVPGASSAVLWASRRA